MKDIKAIYRKRKERLNSNRRLWMMIIKELFKWLKLNDRASMIQRPKLS